MLKNKYLKYDTRISFEIFENIVKALSENGWKFNKSIYEDIKDLYDDFISSEYLIYSNSEYIYGAYSDGGISVNDTEITVQDILGYNPFAEVEFDNKNWQIKTTQEVIDKVQKYDILFGKGYDYTKNAYYGLRNGVEFGDINQASYIRLITLEELNKYVLSKLESLKIENVMNLDNYIVRIWPSGTMTMGCKEKDLFKSLETYDHEGGVIYNSKYGPWNSNTPYTQRQATQDELNYFLEHKTLTTYKSPIEDLLIEAKKKYPLFCTYESTESTNQYTRNHELVVSKDNYSIIDGNTCHVYYKNKWANVIKLPQYVKCIQKDIGLEVGKIYKINHFKGYLYSSNNYEVFYIEGNGDSPYFQTYFELSDEYAYNKQNQKSSKPDIIIPEYVKCIKGNNIKPYNKVGKIYFVEGYNPNKGDITICGYIIHNIFFGGKSTPNSNSTDYEPSTKEDFDCQETANIDLLKSVIDMDKFYIKCNSEEEVEELRKFYCRLSYIASVNYDFIENKWCCFAVDVKSRNFVVNDKLSAMHVPEVKYSDIINTDTLKLDDIVTLDGFDYRVENSALRFYLENLFGDNGKVFYDYGIDKKSFFEKIFPGEKCSGDFPFCSSLNNLKIFIDAIELEIQSRKTDGNTAKEFQELNDKDNVIMNDTDKQYQFKVGDWVYHKNNTSIYHITEIDKSRGTFKAEFGYGHDTFRLSLSCCVPANTSQIQNVLMKYNCKSDIPFKSSDVPSNDCIKVKTISDEVDDLLSLLTIPKI